jgi:hypothetical protein
VAIPVARDRVRSRERREEKAGGAPVVTLFGLIADSIALKAAAIIEGHCEGLGDQSSRRNAMMSLMSWSVSRIFESVRGKPVFEVNMCTYCSSTASRSFAELS